MNLYLPALGDESVLVPLPAKADVYHAALAFRPEIESGKLNVQASDLDINIAKAGYIPTLSLSAGIGTTNANGNDFSFSEQVKNNWNNSLGLTVSIPIFNNRQTKSTVQKARLQKQTSELELLDQQKTLYKNHRKPMAGCQQRTATICRCRRKAAQHAGELRPHPRTIQPGHEEHRRVVD